MRVMVLGSETTIERLSPFLAVEGIEASSTSDGLQAMALLKQEVFDLAAVDCLVDGAEAACSLIRKNSDIPVVLLVDRKQIDWESLESLGIDGYIPDGVGGAELVARLRAVMRRWAFETRPVGNRNPSN